MSSTTNNPNNNNSLEVSSTAFVVTPDNSNNNSDNQQVLITLIDNDEWDQVYNFFVLYPRYAYMIVVDEEDEEEVENKKTYGWTYLHWLCTIPSTPNNIIELLCTINPHSIIVPDQRYNDTPLHLLCRNSVLSSTKVTILLKHCPTTNQQKSIPSITSSSTNTNRDAFHL
jgi:hypothetical protein